ncbi:MULTISPECIES: anthranilate synthase component I [Haloferax]|uniref:Anthranilate synthase component 1 n=1 Tax=Haloferax marinum TaxID=2666143 RepID=A0A6A8GBG4_9EURY|nr:MULTISPECIES: anthranilate synthase component I [Haloferax]KAB1198470.1 anthranilate synthase component I [Haloferax sp. CBA1150]MRW97573.1 anthranilate synthase component I [Haloferax marinum]
MTRPETDRDAFVSAVADYDEPVVTHLVTDLDVDIDPLAAYTALADQSEYGFLLESAEKVSSSNPQGAFSSPATTADSHARFSFVGYDPEAVVTVGPDGVDVTDLGGPAAAFVSETDGDVLDSLRGALPDLPRVNFPEMDRQTLTGGLVGFLAYEAVYDLWLDEVGHDRPETDDPDAEFVLTTKTLAFDHREDTVRLVCTPVVTPDDDPGAVYDAVVAEVEAVSERLATADDPTPGGFERTGATAGSRTSYEAAVRKTKEHVRDGDIYQGVISRTRKLRGKIDPVGLYASLREVNPSPYMYLLRHGDRRVVGASPETLVSVRGDRVVVNPIAGTCPRGSGPVEDRRLAGELLADGKERAEHTMLVDLGRNDVRRVSVPGSVRVEEFMSVIKYSHVQHIESTVSGTLDTEFDSFDATRATFPAGTLTGAPKVRAMEIIDDLEDEPRGVYGGGVGYYSWTGDADMAIVIRTATVETDGHEDVVTVRAGAGIVADSDPASEYDETEQKMGGVLDALQKIEYEPVDAGAGQTEGPR